MFDLSRHPYFEPWTDPVSGVTSYLLSRRVAPLQKTFYFVNSGLSHDGRWLWFEAAYPPAMPKHLAAVCLDPDQPEIRDFPQATISAESPLVMPNQNGVWIVLDDQRTTIHTLDLDGNCEVFAEVPSSFVAGRYVRRISTHLTLSADGKTLLLDGQIGNRWFLATLDVETREFSLIREFDIHYNHSQFSPVDPDKCSIAQDWWVDPDTGKHTNFNQRIWWVNRDGSGMKPLHAPEAAGHLRSHEWWAGDGTQCWVHYEKGAFEWDAIEGKEVHVWKKPLCHAHCERARRYWVADDNPYAWYEKPCRVLAYDRETGLEKSIAHAMPAPNVPRRLYHLDPHPRFIDKGRIVCYTSTVLNRADVALTPVENIFSSSAG